jgi:L-amino acid N-acyltransferase YncA
MLTAKEYRGKHVMWWAMSSILRLQQERGKRWAITFIPSENDISVLAHRKLGFHPYTVRRERRLLLTRSLTFTPFF